MKTSFILAMGALGAMVVLSACGECPCNKINRDYLRDVPVSRTQSFQ